MMPSDPPPTPPRVPSMWRFTVAYGVLGPIIGLAAVALRLAASEPLDLRLVSSALAMVVFPPAQIFAIVVAGVPAAATGTLMALAARRPTQRRGTYVIVGAATGAAFSALWSVVLSWGASPLPAMGPMAALGAIAGGLLTPLAWRTPFLWRATGSAAPD